MLGPPRVPLEGCRPDKADLLAEMKRLSISKSIVRHRVCLDVNGYLGNDILMEQIAGHDDLIPAWFITSDGREPDFDPEVIIDKMLSAGVRLAWTDSKAEGFSIQPWCSGKMLRALQERKVPLILSYDKVTPDELYSILIEFNELRIILLDVPRLGRNRMLEPLLEAHSELYLCFGPSFSVHEGFRDLCRRYGPYRWVWGMGYPDFEGGSAITNLTYSGLTYEEMAAVAHGNIERLIAEVIQ